MAAVNRSFWPLLVREIEAVRQRWHFLRRTIVTLLVSIGLILGAAILWSVGLGGWLAQSGLPEWSLWPTAFLIGIAVVALIGFPTSWVLGRSPAVPQVVDDLERSFPELDAKLHALWSERAREPHAPWNYLQDQLLRETLIHARRNWNTKYSPERMLALRGLALFTSLVAIIVISALLVRSSGLIAGLTSPDRSAIPARYPSSQWKIAPGDVEIEFGSSLLVTARLPGLALDSLELVVETNDQTLTFPMAANLRDPVYSARIPSIQSPAKYRVESDVDRTQDFHITVFQRPRLESFEVRVLPPSFTGMNEKVIRDPRRLQGVRGTRIEMTAVFSGEPVTAKVTSDHLASPAVAEAVTDSTQQLTTLQANWELTQDERLTWAVIDRLGHSPKEALELQLSLIPNKPVELKWIHPTSDLSAHPLQEIELVAKAEDDFGVVKQGFVVLDPIREPLEIEVDREVSGEVMWEHLLMLENYDLRPGRMLAVSAWAEDLDDSGTHRRMVSDLILIDIRPFERIFRQADADQVAQEAPSSSSEPGAASGGPPEIELAERQKQTLIATWNLQRRLPGSEGWSDDLAVILESQLAISDELRTLLREASSNPAQGIALDPDTQLQLERAALTAVDGLLETTRNQNADALPSTTQAQQQILESLISMAPEESEVAQQQGGSPSSSGQRAGGPSQQELQALELTPESDRYVQESQARQASETNEAENRERLERLQELSQRQQDLNREMQSEARAESPQSAAEEQEQQERLARLREQQRQLQEAAEKMQEDLARTPSSTEDREQLEQARDAAQRAAEALASGEVEEALTQGRRSAEELSELQNRMDRSSGSALRREIEALDQRLETMQREQTEIQESLENLDQVDEPGLRGNDQSSELREQMRERERAWETELENLRTLTEESEATEPRVSERLYDAFRSAQRGDLPRASQESRKWLEEGYPEQSAPLEEAIREELGELRESLQGAAELAGRDEIESLELAEELLDELEEEVAGDSEREATPGERNSANASGDEPSDESQNISNGNSNAEANQESSGDENQSSDSRGVGSVESPSENNPGSPTDNSSSESGEPSDSNSGQENPASSQAGLRPGPRGGAAQPSPGGNPNGFGPSEARELEPRESALLGDDFRDWSDRLEDVESLVPAGPLRDDAIRIRERAELMRRDYLRHAQEPDAATIRTELTEPLRRLALEVAAERRRLDGADASVRLDKDTIPPKYQDQVRRYFERLGAGRQ